jgi:hypothetical protein
MAYVLNAPNFPRVVGQLRALVEAPARMMATEHELALRAAAEAGLHRQRLADLRAMYLSAASRIS